MYSRPPYSTIPYSSFRVATVAGEPFAQVDWPNPVLRKRDAVTQLTWTDSFKLPLQQVLPFNQMDWPVPKGPKQPLDLLTWLQSYVQNLPIPVLNIMNYDWPNPRGPAFPISLLTWTQAFAQNLPPPDMGPRQLDWPNPPLGPRRGTPFWTQSAKAPFIPLGSIPMARMRDWPVPKGPQRAVSLLTFIGRTPNFPEGPTNPAQTTLANFSGRVRWLENEVERTRFLAKNPNL